MLLLSRFQCSCYFRAFYFNRSLTSSETTIEPEEFYKNKQTTTNKLEIPGPTIYTVGTVKIKNYTRRTNELHLKPEEHKLNISVFQHEL